MKLFTNKEIIARKTLELLQRISNDNTFNGFFFVGGTNLALQIGHRESIDLDFFTLTDFDVDTIETYLVEEYGALIDKKSKNTLIASINGVKVDFITQRGKLVNDLLEVDGLRLASILDICAMKLNAVSSSGQRQKDFYDLYFLLEHFTLQEMLDAYEIKYPNSNLSIPLKALIWFEDIDFEVEKPKLVQKVTFKQVKLRLLAASRNVNKRF
jgi:hypothetical protein